MPSRGCIGSGSVSAEGHAQRELMEQLDHWFARMLSA